MNQPIRTIIIAISVVILAMLSWLTWQYLFPATTPSPATRTSAPSPANTQLVISEWQVKLPLSPDIATATYTFDQANNRVHITTPRLTELVSQVKGCTSGLDAVYVTRSTLAPSADRIILKWRPAKAGKYYYYSAPVTLPACVPQPNKDLATDINAINTSLHNALERLSME